MILKAEEILHCRISEMKTLFKDFWRTLIKLKYYEIKAARRLVVLNCEYSRDYEFYQRGQQ